MYNKEAKKEEKQTVTIIKQTLQDWLYKPLWGEKPDVESFKLITRRTIPKKDIDLYNKYLNQIKPASKILQLMDNSLFTHPDFLFFLDVKQKLKNNVEPYHDLGNLLRLFQVAIEAKDIFLKINEIESRYGSSIQQQLYKYADHILAKNINPEDFIKEFNQKTLILVTKIKTDEGRNALLSYQEVLLKLAQKGPLALQLFGLFKKDHLSDFSILMKISDIRNNLLDKNLQDFDLFSQIVIEKEEIFVKLGTIIEVPTAKNNAATFAIMLQYITLDYKYNQIYERFQKLLEILMFLGKRYSAILTIRNEYPLMKYKQPESFREKLPAFELYKKYYDYLPSKEIILK